MASVSSQFMTAEEFYTWAQRPENRDHGNLAWIPGLENIPEHLGLKFPVSELFSNPGE